MALVKVVRPQVAYTDLQQAPEDGRRYELYDGEVFVVPAPVPRHQRVAQNVYDLLRVYEPAHGGMVFMAPTDIVFSEFEVVQPDVVFIKQSRLPLIDLSQPIRMAPDLAVEVLSPSTAITDRGKKMQMLARYGVQEYWLVDPAPRTAEIYRLDEGNAYLLLQVAVESDEIRSLVLQDLLFPARLLFEE